MRATRAGAVAMPLDQHSTGQLAVLDHDGATSSSSSLQRKGGRSTVCPACACVQSPRYWMWPVHPRFPSLPRRMPRQRHAARAFASRRRGQVAELDAINPRFKAKAPGVRCRLHHHPWRRGARHQPKGCGVTLPTPITITITLTDRPNGQLSISTDLCGPIDSLRTPAEAMAMLTPTGN